MRGAAVDREQDANARRRDMRLRLPTEQRDRHPQVVHHDGERYVLWNSCGACPCPLIPTLIDAAPQEESSKITAQATGATSWRRGDVRYKKNEAFVDVIEEVNLSMSAKGASKSILLPIPPTDQTPGTVLRADVDGHIQMRAYLSGTPECKFGLNDKLVIDKSDRGMIDAVELDDCRFHQCVRLHDFDATRTISFIPPDGEFELMKYRCTTNVKLPLRVIPTVTEIGKTQVSYNVTVKTNFNNKLSATNIVVRIPTPLNTTTVDCQVLNGKAKYTPAENAVVWKYVPHPFRY